MKRHTADQIIPKRRPAEADLAQGLTLAHLRQRLAISEPTLHRWPHHYGGHQVRPASSLRYRRRAELGDRCPRPDAAALRWAEDTSGAIDPILTAPGT